MCGSGWSKSPRPSTRASRSTLQGTSSSRVSTGTFSSSTILTRHSLDLPSLDATFLRNRIVAMLKASGDKQAQAAAPHITQNFVFENPTIESLALALSTLVATGTNINKQNMSKEMLRILEQYSLGLPTPTAAQSSAASDGAVVLLSGATGNVGVYILAALLEEEKVEKVYTLNRPSPDAAKQARAFADKGLDVELLKSKKLVPLVGDMTKDAFGLAPDVLNEVRPYAKLPPLTPLTRSW